MATKHFAVIVGTRPNFVKAAAFFREAKKHPDFRFTLIHTGQHFDENMSRIFFEEMKIPKPDIHLEVGNGLHTERIGKMFSSLRDVFSQHYFDALVVFGDVNSTLAGAVAAAKAGNEGLRLIHIESGLRSHDRRMPEEINRVIVDHLSDVLFTSEPSANENLKREGVPESNVHYVGNIMIESIELFRDKIAASSVLEELGLEPKMYTVATIHRQENTDDSRMLGKIFTLLRRLNETRTVVLPLHPGTRNKIAMFGLSSLLDNLHSIEPLGYFDFLKLVSESGGVVTDSGGIQEETTHLGIPCCTIRDNTERPVTLEQGSNKLFPLASFVSADINQHLSRTDFKAGSIPLWDNKVSERIFEHL